MKKISSDASFLYSVVWPSLILVRVPIILWIMVNFNKIPFCIPLGIFYIAIDIWIITIFLKLRNVWIDSELLIVERLGHKTTINKNEISEISQNMLTVTPRIVTIKFKTQTAIGREIKFIPTNGHWLFWHHNIEDELRSWTEKSNK
jgi:hypothetical protein